MKPQYWIDLTDLAAWSGNHTGIQRVVYNLARQFHNEGTARFFIYDDNGHRFEEVPFSVIKAPTLDRLRRLSRRREIRDNLLYSAKTNYNRLPLGLRQQLTPALKPLAGALYRRAHHTAFVTHRFITKPRGRKHRYPAADFGPNDTVVVLGAGWHLPTLLEALWRRKQTDGFKIAHFIHDLIPTYFPHLFGPGHFELATNYTFDVANMCDLVITNSQASKRDMERFCRELNLPQIPVGVVRLADAIELEGEPLAPEVPLEPGFIFSFGTIENRKNHILLYTAYKLAIQRGIKLPQLVIAGRPGWNTKDVLYAIRNDPEVRGKIILLSSPHDLELSWLYRNCRYSVYPSSYEGWGMPVAESLVLGKLALTTNISSMPEIAGDLIDYFSPFDSAECLEVMSRYLDDDLLAAKEAAIREKYKVQTWQDTYAETLAVLGG